MVLQGTCHYPSPYDEEMVQTQVGVDYTSDTFQNPQRVWHIWPIK